MDYLTYAYLQRGRIKEADQVATDLAAMHDLPAADFKMAYAATAIPVRIAVESGHWDATTSLEPLQHSAANVRALIYWARSLGHSRGGHVEAIDPDIQNLQACLTELQSAKNVYWASQVQAQLEEAQAWRLYAKGDAEAAKASLRAAADLEDSVEKLPVTPGPVIPAREQLGELLLSLNQPKPALQEFESTLKLAPRRRGALLGAIAAADQVGDAHTAQRFRTELTQ